MTTLFRVCGHDCFPKGKNCNGYCEGKEDSPAAYEVGVEWLLNKAAAGVGKNLDLLLLSASHEITQLREQLDAQAEQISVAREAIGGYLTANDPSEFGCACDPSVGHMCGPCRAYDRQTILRQALAKLESSK